MNFLVIRLSPSTHLLPLFLSRNNSLRILFPNYTNGRQIIWNGHRKLLWNVRPWFSPKTFLGESPTATEVKCSYTRLTLLGFIENGRKMFRCSRRNRGRTAEDAWSQHAVTSYIYTIKIICVCMRVLECPSAAVLYHQKLKIGAWNFVSNLWMIMKFAVLNLIKVPLWGLHPVEWSAKICAKQNTSRYSSFEISTIEVK